MAKKKGSELTENEIKNLKLIQHNMALEGHEISLDELIEVKKKSLVDGDEERIKRAIELGEKEGLTDSEALAKYLFNEESAPNE